jgi:Na+-translocating ferredoxin:NAD+ oxidoreductase RNF subunit RnfB
MDILIAIGILGGLGLVFGLILAAASKIFYVETDPRLDKLNECLPGANCGGCGYAGCGGYAEAVLKGEAEIGKCASGGNECAQAMAEIMGVKVEAMIRKVALVRCSGYRSIDASGKELGAKRKGEYEGFHDCMAASKVGGNGYISCKVINQVDLQTHVMFICDVTQCVRLSDKETMTYTYYQKNVKPKPETDKKGYVCKICGYVYEGSELPEDYICPLCKHGVQDFEPIG